MSVYSKDYIFTILFIHDSFNGAVNSLHYTVSDDRIINEQWTGKDMEGNRRGLIYGTIPAFAWRGWGKPW
jgi:hypothetical protein